MGYIIPSIGKWDWAAAAPEQEHKQKHENCQYVDGGMIHWLW